MTDTPTPTQSVDADTGRPNRYEHATYEQAVDDYDKVESRLSELGRYFYERACAHHEHGEHAQVVTEMSRVLRLDPTDAEARLIRAASLWAVTSREHPFALFRRGSAYRYLATRSDDNEAYEAALVAIGDFERMLALVEVGPRARHTTRDRRRRPCCPVRTPRPPQQRHRQQRRRRRRRRRERGDRGGRWGWSTVSAWRYLPTPIPVGLHLAAQDALWCLYGLRHDAWAPPDVFTQLLFQMFRAADEARFEALYEAFPAHGWCAEIWIEHPDDPTALRYVARSEYGHAEHALAALTAATDAWTAQLSGGVR
ncbi:MAG: hypothetical protein AAF531_10460 [Actinomycetota bacterium]